MRKMEGGINCQRLLIARTRVGEPALSAVDHPELVVRDRVIRIDRERLAEARLRAIEIPGAAVGDPEIDVRSDRRRCAFRHLDEQRDALLVLLLREQSQRVVVVGSHVTADTDLLRHREPGCVVSDLDLGCALRRQRWRRTGGNDQHRPEPRRSAHPNTHARVLSARLQGSPRRSWRGRRHGWSGPAVPPASLAAPRAAPRLGCGAAASSPAAAGAGGGGAMGTA